MLSKYLKILIIYFFGLVLFLQLSDVYGGERIGAIEEMGLLMSANINSEEPTLENEPDDDDVENSDEKGQETTSCGPEALVPVERCEIGQGTLCLNTPELSVIKEYVIVKGTVDRRTSLFSHLRVFSQHEYTKEFNEIEIEDWAEVDCRENGWAESYDGCLDREGFFGVKVPLPELGPYTIMIDSVGLNGEAASKTVRTSSVVPAELSKEMISLDPDSAEVAGTVASSKVKLTVDILKDCINCDFYGATTGGLMITVTNMIESTEGGIKTIVRKGNISANGKYDICVPVIKGKNKLSVKACNAATGNDCPEVHDISYNVTSGDIGINIITPNDSKIIYEAEQYNEVPLKFTIDNFVHKDGCKKGDVLVTWNRYESVSLCPDSNGEYKARLIPNVGVNMGTIEAFLDGVRYAKSFMIGYGSLKNPYKDDESGWIGGALAAHIGSKYLNEKIRPVFNNFLSSDNLKTFLSDMMSVKMPDVKEDELSDEEKEKKQRIMSEIKRELPNCSAEEADSGLVIQLVGEPAIGLAEIERFIFDDSSMTFKMDLQDVEARVKVFKDKNKDNLPDGKILPLLISLRGAQLDGKIEVKKNENSTLLLITSDHTDCDYMSSAYCKNKPAFLIPQNIVGGATRGGAFVRCDDKGQAANQGCVGLNILNSQTGQLNQTVLDMINDMIYCNGSAALTYLIREGMKDVSAHIGCETSESGTDCSDLPSLLHGKDIRLSAGMKPAEGEIKIAGSGIFSEVPMRVGSTSAAADMDPAVKNDEVGIIAYPMGLGNASIKRNPDSISISLAIDLLNQLLFQLSFQKSGSGLFDWSIDEKFFNDLGFDFVEECDAFEPTPEVQTPSVLCQLWPRVTEMLGSALITNGYFNGKHPIRMKLEGSRRIAPRIEIYKADVPYELPPVEGEDEIKIEYRTAQILELQIPDVEISFYALEIDESAGLDIYGNPATLLDSNGNPVVRSMIEDSKEDIPIIRIKVSLLLAMELGELKTSNEDFSKLSLSLRLVPELIKIAFNRIKGANATLVDDESIFSAFREKLMFGFDAFGDPDDPINLLLPKSIALDFLGAGSSDDLMSMFGLEQIFFGSEGLKLNFDNGAQRIDIEIKPEIEQNLN